MMADIRTAAQRRKFATVEEMMNDPDQRGVEVKVAHRYGYWMIDSGDGIDADEIAEADAYLEAHIQHRISEARVTPTREQLEALMVEQFKESDMPWLAESPEKFTDAVLVLMAGLAEGEVG